MGDRAIVVGGGIGGLAAGLALHQHGWRVEVLERAAEFSEIGAGLAVQPNALSALDQLGLGAAVRDRGLIEPPLGIRGANGRWLTRYDLPALRNGVKQWVMLERADLLHLLLSAVPARILRPGVDVYDVTRDGVVEHSQGTSKADVVVGADGLRSVIRRSMWPEAPGPRFAGFGTQRFITTPHDVDGTVETWGRGARFGYSPLPDGRVYCYVMADAAEGVGGDFVGLRRRLIDWHTPIPELVAAADETGAIYHDTFDLPNLRTFVSGRVALLGDAAHAMTPNLGQGAGQALEDAVVLAAALDGAAVSDALNTYDRVRRPRTQMVVQRSRRVAAIARGGTPLLAPVRDLAMSLAPRSTMTKTLEPIVSWRADAAHAGTLSP